MLFAQAFDPLRSVRTTGALFRRAPLTIFVGSLVPLATQFCLGAFVQTAAPLPMPYVNAIQMESWMPIVALCSLGLTLVCTLLSCWIDVGFARAVEQVLRTGTGQTRTVFRGADRLGTMILARVYTLLVLGALVLATLLLAQVLAIGLSLRIHALVKLGALLGFGCAVTAVWLYVALGFSMVTAIVALEDCSASAAVARSWRFASGNRLWLLWFQFFLFLLSVTGTLACCLGLLVAIPLLEAMRYEAYVALTRGTQYPQWWIGGTQPVETFASPE